MGKSLIELDEEASRIELADTFLDKKPSALRIFNTEFPDDEVRSLESVKEAETSPELDPYSSIEKDLTRKVRASLAIGDEETRTESYITSVSTTTKQAINQIDDCISIETAEIEELNNQIKGFQNLRRYHIDELERFKRIKIANDEFMETLSIV